MISCSLCDKRYIKKEVVNLYLCYDCHKKTSFCLNCDKIMMKIFEYENMFKCEECRKITPFISKELVEITKTLDLNPFLNVSGIDNNILNPQENINNKNNKTIIFNNSNVNSPSDYKLLNQLNKNKIDINSPLVNSPFRKNIFTKTPIPKFKKNNNLEINENNIDFNNNNNIINENDGNTNNNINDNENNEDINNNFEEGNNISCLTDINKDTKVRHKIYSEVDHKNNRKILFKKYNKTIDYFDLTKSRLINYNRNSSKDNNSENN